MELVVSILGFCAILTFVSIRSNFFGLKLMASMSWMGFIVWWKSSPPTGVVEGSSFHTVIFVVAIGFALMIALSGLFRGIQRTDRWTDSYGNEKEERSNGFKTPGFITNIFKDEESPKERKIRSEKKRQDYEDRMDQALRIGKYNSRRR